MNTKNIIDSIGDPFIGWLAATALFTLILHFFPTTGKTVIIIIIAFFLGDFIATWFIQRKEGRVTIAVAKTSRKGHIFLGYYMAIILSSIVAGMAADLFVNDALGSILGSWFNEFVIAALLSMFIWMEMQLKYYIGGK